MDGLLTTAVLTTPACNIGNTDRAFVASRPVARISRICANGCGRGHPTAGGLGAGRYILQLERDGVAVKKKTLYRLRRKEWLTVRQRGDGREPWAPGAYGDPSGSEPRLATRLRLRHSGRRAP